jgi:hypothetical protein
LAKAIIDSGAKPYFIAGGVIAIIFFVSFGAILTRPQCGRRYARNAVVRSISQYAATTPMP